MPPTPIAIAVTKRLGLGVISIGIRNPRARGIQACIKQLFHDRTDNRVSRDGPGQKPCLTFMQVRSRRRG